MPEFRPPEFGQPLFESAQTPQEERLVYRAWNDYVGGKLAAPTIRGFATHTQMGNSYVGGAYFYFSLHMY